ncbi:MAG: hypothetical protein ACE5H7_00065 [Acidiferrobacterales bacterium]
MSRFAALRSHALVIVTALLILPGVSAATGQVDFATTVSQLGNQDHYRDKRPQERVEVSLPGTLYAPPITVTVVGNKDADRSTLLGAVASDYSAWRNDNAKWILSNFVPEDQQGLKKFLANEELRRANSMIFSPDRTMEVWGIVKYKGYGLVLFTYDNTRKFGAVATFRQVGDEWKRTNALSGDRVFDVVWSAFRSGDVTKK